MSEPTEAIRQAHMTEEQMAEMGDQWWDHKAMERTLTLCGSTKFKEAYEKWNERLTLAGFLVFSVGLFGHQREMPLTPDQKRSLDEIHFRKIDASGGIVVLDVGGYIGHSTTREIAYAEKTGKAIYRISDGTADAILADKEGDDD